MAVGQSPTKQAVRVTERQLPGIPCQWRWDFGGHPTRGSQAGRKKAVKQIEAIEKCTVKLIQ